MQYLDGSDGFLHKIPTSSICYIDFPLIQMNQEKLLLETTHQLHFKCLLDKVFIQPLTHYRMLNSNKMFWLETKQLKVHLTEFGISITKHTVIQEDKFIHLFIYQQDLIQMFNKISYTEFQHNLYSMLEMMVLTEDSMVIPGMFNYTLVKTLIMKILINKEIYMDGNKDNLHQSQSINNSNKEKELDQLK